MQAMATMSGFWAGTDRTVRLALAMAFGTMALQATADTVVLRNGTTQTGLVKSQDPRTGAVTLITANGQITIPGERVLEVRKDSPAQGHVRLGDQFLNSKQFSRAIEEYRKALELAPNDAETSTKLSLAETGLAEERLNQAAKEADRQRRVINEARALIARKQYEQASEMLKPIALAEATMPPAAREVLVELNIAWAKDRLDRQDPGGASERLQTALRLDPTNEEALRLLTKAWEGDPGKIDEVIEALKASNRPEDRPRLADALFRKRDYEAALPLYQELLANEETATESVRERLRLLYDLLHRRYAQAGDFKKALDTYRAFLEFSPTEDPTPYYRYEYMVMKSQTAQEDIEGRVKLALYAEQVGMSEVARQEFQNLYKASPQTSSVVEGLYRFATADLQQANDFFDTGQYTMASVTAQKVMQNYPMFPDLTRAAGELKTRAQVEERRMAKELQQNAERLAQRGDQYFQQGQGYLEMYISTDRNQQLRVINPRWEAVKCFDMAISTWREALRLDPSLGAVTSYDLNRKIADAQAKRASLANTRLPYVPRSPTTIRISPVN
jgi:tetratricopeptide (TPR) repeat protein